jgi:hypothetical protein
MKLACVFLLSVAFSTSLLAATTSIAGRGKAEYTNPIGKPGKEVEDQARKEAIYDAIDRALEDQSAALREQYKKFGKNVPAEEYESKGIVTPQGKGVSTTDAKKRVVTFQYAGSLDVQALRDLLNGMSSKEGGTDVKLSKISCALMFTVRQTSENFVFDPKRVVGTKREDSVEVEGKAVTAGGGGVEAVEGAAKKVVKSTASIESGTAQRVDKQKFELEPQSRDAFGNGLSAVLTAKGFKKVKQGRDLDVSTAVDQGFGSGEGLSPAVRRQLHKEVRQQWANVKYLILGTLDFSMPTIDPVTGQHAYVGRIGGEVFAYDEDGDSEMVAALEPVQSKAFATTQQDAKARCIQRMSEEAANEIITKLRNKEGL